MKDKVTVIGAGNVGSTVAQLIAQSGLADVVLFDIIKDMPQGKALDISEACPLWGSSSNIRGTNDYSDIKGSSIVVITAGIARKPGMSRDDLLAVNASIIKGVSKETANYCPDAVVVVVTNPMDVMSQVVFRETEFEARRVMGMGGVLDSARFRAFVANELGVSAEDTEALVLGGHGDQMVPLPRYTTVRGISIMDLLDNTSIERLVGRTRNGGAEIVGLLKNGSAYYAPAASAFQMVKCILLNEKRMVPCSVMLNGEYGIKGVFAGVPVILGRQGVEKIIDLKLDKNEKRALLESIKAVEKLLSKIY